MGVEDVEGEALHAGKEVHVFDDDVFPFFGGFVGVAALVGAGLNDDGGEVQDAAHACFDEVLCGGLGVFGGHGDEAHVDALWGVRVPLHEVVQGVDVLDGEVVDFLADQFGVAVEQADVLEAVVVRAGVVGDGVPEAAHADDDDVPGLVEAQDAHQFAFQDGDGVAHAARAETPEVGEVLAHLEGRDAGAFREVVAAGAADVLGFELFEDAQVRDQSADGGGGNLGHGVYRTRKCSSPALSRRASARRRASPL